VNFSEEDIQSLVDSERKEAAFLLNAIRFVNAQGHAAYCTVIDCMAVAYVIDPTLVETMQAHVGIETKDGLTLGMTVIDRRHHYVWEQLPIINVGCKADCGRFLQLLMKLVLA
jgi:purine nucleosidase/pyrimidine-specific ribonucleoside hydrolase